MPPRSTVPNPHAGGYSSTVAAGLDRIVLPERARCRACRRVQATTNRFSNRQLADLRHYIYSYREPSLQGPGVIRCMSCVGGQVIELTCTQCDETRSLDDFSLAQRRNPDNAVCWDCACLIQNTIPVDEAVTHVLNEGSEYLTQRTTINGENSTHNNVPANPMDTVNSQVAGRFSESVSKIESTNADHTIQQGGVWQEQLRRGADNHTSRQASENSNTARATEENPVRAESMAGSVGPSEWADWANPASGSVHSQYACQAQEGNNSNFARVPGRRVPVGHTVGLNVPQTCGAVPDITTPAVRPANSLHDEDDDDDEDDEDDDHIQNYL